jgi:hypothetical protein
MTTRPATPLPWTFRESGPTKYGVLGSVHIPRERSVMSNNRDDAAYIVHAANSYPRLVEALKECVKPANPDHAQACIDARALLRSLGESE